MSSNLPIVLICGSAGSGKDTAAEYLARGWKGVSLGQADPIKRFVRSVFDFSVNDLWGESELRSVRSPRFNADIGTMRQLLDDLDCRFSAHATSWIKECLPYATPVQIETAHNKLHAEFQELTTRVGKHLGLTPRFSLQIIGTEWGRTCDLNIWVDLAIRNARKLLWGNAAYDRQTGISYNSPNRCDFVLISDGRFRNEIMQVRQAGGIAIKIERANKPLPDEISNHGSETELDTIPDHFYDAIIRNDGSLDRLYGNLSEVMFDHYSTIIV